MATRPLTGLTIWRIISTLGRPSNAMTFRRALAFASSVALGAVPPLLALLYYNQVTNGDPYTFGYAAVHGHFHSLGFGRRGALLYAGQMQPVYSNIDLFTPRSRLKTWPTKLGFCSSCIAMFSTRAAALGGRHVPLSISCTLHCAIPVHAGRLLFYFGNDIRFYTELIPFIALGTALLLTHVARQGSRHVLAWVLGIVVLGNLADAIATTVAEIPRARGVTRNARNLRTLADEVGSTRRIHSRADSRILPFSTTFVLQ